MGDLLRLSIGLIRAVAHLTIESGSGYWGNLVIYFAIFCSTHTPRITNQSQRHYYLHLERAVKLPHMIQFPTTRISRGTHVTFLAEGQSMFFSITPQVLLNSLPAALALAAMIN